MTENVRKSAAGKTLLGFVAVVAMVAVLNVRERVYREANEEWYFPSALGDTELFTGHAGVPEGSRVADFEGRPLVVRSERLRLQVDWRMMKVGRDDEDRYFVYRAPAPAEEETDGTEEIFYLKAEQGEGEKSRYVELARIADAEGGEGNQ